MLTLAFTRISPTHHTLAYKRSDGTGESIELESKSFLMHDFLHLSLESEAKLHGGFFGLLDSGKTYAELSAPDAESLSSNEAGDIERIVGPLTGIAKGVTTPREVYLGIQNLYDALGEDVPRWFSEELIAKAAERYRKIAGAWGSAKFGEKVEYTFDV